MSTQDQPDQSDQAIIDEVASDVDQVRAQIAQLDNSKKPLSKKLSKHKSSVRKLMKRKLEEAQVNDPTLDSLVIKVGNTTFTLEQVKSCAPCKVDDMEAFFNKDNVDKYKAAMEKKRFKLNVE